MRFTKLGIIVGLVYWLTERVWDNPDLLWPLLMLTLGGAVIGVIMDAIWQRGKSTPSENQPTPQDQINAKKQAYMEKLKQKKAADKDFGDLS